MKKSLLSVLIFWITLCTYIQTYAHIEDNPFAGIVGKSYGEYVKLIQDVFDYSYDKDSAGQWKLIEQFYQAVEKADSPCCKISARHFEYVIRFRLSKKDGFDPVGDYSSETYIEDMIQLKNMAEKSGCEEIYASMLYNIAEVYRLHVHNYEEAFHYYRLLEDKIENYPIEKFPYKYMYYLQMGDLYLAFRDYENAKRIYYKIIGGDSRGVSFNYLMKHAYNGLSICFRAEKEFEKSNDCLQKILDEPHFEGEDIFRYEGLKGVAVGNMGVNDFMSGNYESAKVRLKDCIERMRIMNDYYFMSGKAIVLAEVYMIEGDMKNTRKYLDSAKRYYDISNNEIGLKDYYRVEAKYNSIVGNPELSNLFIDKMRAAEQLYNDTFNARQLLRVEQKLRKVESEALSESIEFEKNRKEYYQRTLIIISVFVVLLLSLLSFLIVNYMRKKRAYTALIKKTQSWAGMNKNTEKEESVIEATEDEIKLYSAITDLFEKEQIYKDYDLTIDTLAKRLNINKLYISRAINRCSGSSFSGLVNEFRIKEAVKLLSKEKSNKLSLEGVAFDVGYNQRKTFYSAFKKITGLSPSEYRNNLQDDKS